MRVIQGHAVDAVRHLRDANERFDLLATDPPYAFGGDGKEHELTAVVGIALREAAQLVRTGGWVLVMCAASHRSEQYMRDALRGIAQPVRRGTWVKPQSRTKVKTAGWQWASVSVLAFRRGKSSLSSPAEVLDWIEHPPQAKARRAAIPTAVADWMVAPFVTDGGAMLDCFSGSGALPLAAERAGMVATGIDIEPQQRPDVRLVHDDWCDLDDDCTCFPAGA